MLGNSVFIGVSHPHKSSGGASPNSLGPLLTPIWLTYSDRIWCRNTYEVGVCLLRSAMPPSEKGRVPAFSKFLGPFTCVNTVREMATKFYMVIKLDARKIFPELSMNADVRSVCGK